MRCLSKVLSCLERTTLGGVIYLLICNSALVFHKNIINKWSFRYCALGNLGISTFGEGCRDVQSNSSSVRTKRGIKSTIILMVGIGCVYWTSSKFYNTQIPCSNQHMSLKLLPRMTTFCSIILK